MRISTELPLKKKLDPDPTNKSRLIVFSLSILEIVICMKASLRKVEQCEEEVAQKTFQLQKEGHIFKIVKSRQNVEEFISEEN